MALEQALGYAQAKSWGKIGVWIDSWDILRALQGLSLVPGQAKALFADCKIWVNPFSILRVFKINKQLVKEAHDLGFLARK